MRGEKRELTHTFLQSLKPKAAIYEIFDTEVTGLGVRISPKGKKTFFLLARFGGPESNPARRALGHFDSTALVPHEHKNKKVNVSLADAREKAREWKKAIEKGIDPKNEIDRVARENIKKAEATFEVVAEQFIATKLEKIRRRSIYENDIRKRFIPLWGHRPISEIGYDDIETFISGLVDQGKKSQARVCLSELRCIFKWAMTKESFGLKRKTPLAGFDVKETIGDKSSRDRILDEDEIKALWRVCEELPYPWKEIYKLLILTGQRISEMAGLSWPEVDLAGAKLKIPASRMKSKKPHECPLPPMAFAIIDGLPRFEEGNFCFSNCFGKKPVTAYSFGKRLVDKKMPPNTAAWVAHDLRRTMRSGLSDLHIPVVVAEQVIAHRLSGLLAVYDHGNYEERKMEALTAWENKLRSIIEPQPGNIVQLRA